MPLTRRQTRLSSVFRINDLPLEVLAIVIGHLRLPRPAPWLEYEKIPHQADLAACMRVNSTWNRIAAPVLFHTIVVSDYPSLVFGWECPPIDTTDWTPASRVKARRRGRQTAIVLDVDIEPLTTDTLRRVSKAECFNYTRRIFFEDPPWRRPPALMASEVVREETAARLGDEILPPALLATTGGWVWSHHQAIVDSIETLNVALFSRTTDTLLLRSMAFGAYSSKLDQAYEKLVRDTDHRNSDWPSVDLASGWQGAVSMEAYTMVREQLPLASCRGGPGSNMVTRAWDAGRVQDADISSSVSSNTMHWHMDAAYGPILHITPTVDPYRDIHKHFNFLLRWDQQYLDRSAWDGADSSIADVLYALRFPEEECAEDIILKVDYPHDESRNTATLAYMTRKWVEDLTGKACAEADLGVVVEREAWYAAWRLWAEGAASITQAGEVSGEPEREYKIVIEEADGPCVSCG